MFKIVVAVALALAAQTVDGQKTVYPYPTSRKVHGHTLFRYDYKPVSLKVVKEDKPSPKPVIIKEGKPAPKPVTIIITKPDDDKDAKPSPKPASPKPTPKPASPKPSPQPSPKPSPQVAPQPSPKSSPEDAPLPTTQPSPQPSPTGLSDEDMQFMAEPSDVLSDEDVAASPEPASTEVASPKPASPEVVSPEPTECTTVADAVVGTPELSTLLSALQAADLVDTFTDPELVATVLAPTNDAFDVLITAFNATAEQVLSDPQLQNILLYHVIPDVAVLSTELEDGAEVPTLLGQDLTVSLNADEVTFEGDQTSAKVVTPDFEACKAVVHVIDTVLLPDFSAIA